MATKRESNSEHNDEPKGDAENPLEADDKLADELGGDQVREAIEKEQEQGFSGVEVDPTPNENYTLEGVTSDAPTPETDDDASSEARQRLEQNRKR